MLDGFRAPLSGGRLQNLHDALWPKEPLPTMPSATRAVPRGQLTSYMKIYQPPQNSSDDGSDDGSDDDSDDSMEDDSDDGSYDKPVAPPIYYLDASVFRVFGLSDAIGPKRLLVRDEYLEFLADVEKDRGNPPKPVRYFVSGQPGIGKSLGSCYFLFHLLASGQPVFMVRGTTVTYFGPDGCEIPLNPARISQDVDGRDLDQAIARSWVLIDMDRDENWMPADWTARAAVVVWTSPPHDWRMRKFQSYWRAQTWYMRPWTQTELNTIVALEFPLKRDKLLPRIQTKGPVARSVFHCQSSLDSENYSLERDIHTIINRGSYHSWHNVEWGEVLLIMPRETVDEATGVVTLLRDCYNVAFVSNHVAQLVATAMQKSHEMYREVYGPRLAAVFDATWLQSAVGSLFENILHGALHRGEIDSTAVQDIFGVSTVSAAVMLAGDATNFVVEVGKDAEISERPLYLRPFSTTFGAVNSIFTTAGAVYLIQCALGESHPFVVKTLLLILHRLDTNLGIDLSKLQLVYCIIGSEGARVKQIVNETDTKLEEFKKVRPKELKGVSLRAVARLNTMVVSGAVFDPVKNALLRIVV
ncbi:hypothetical protein C8R45DRAFT_998539 [Mycena sanguinolenta]|nr:hypothetical protein C8R45DRAFT_998539 [Mycena sanguinolenta]